MFRQTLKLVDGFLNKITMYRLALYYLALLLAVAIIFSYLGLIPYSPAALSASAVVITIICLATNMVFAKTFGVQTNVESVYITALILALIITPPKFSGGSLLDYFSFIGWAAIWSMASKYIFAIRKKHIFNPAAFAVALTSVTINQSASWWIGNLYMLPFVIAGGLLLTRKIIRSDLVLSFLIASLSAVLVFGLLKNSDLINVFKEALFYSPLIFFSFVMITEPLTSPPAKLRRICYGALTGFLFAPFIHIGSVYSTPELALLIGNIFSYGISPKAKLTLKLKQKLRISADIYDFIFAGADRKLIFKPGQYLEWTLGYKHPDSRGNRRYFTIASSPTENEIRLGVKFYNNPSSFKKALLSMDPGAEIAASQLAGDFTMPRNKAKKLAFIAGGIGITPFRSMIKYMIDNNEKRSVILIYSNKTVDNIAYKNIFDEAEQKLGIKVVYKLTEQTGYIDEQTIKKEVPDFKSRIFYISGSHLMVTAVENILLETGVKSGMIKKDFFPGLA